MGARDDWRIDLVDTGVDTQTGGRIRRLADRLSGDTFMLTYGDAVADVKCRELVDFHRRDAKLPGLEEVLQALVERSFGGEVQESERQAELRRVVQSVVVRRLIGLADDRGSSAAVRSRVEGTLRVLDKPAPYAIYNIGNHTPVGLLDYIATIERVLGRKAKLEMKPMQPGDVKATYADTRALEQAVGFSPATPLESGLARFAEWFRSYYRL